METCIPIQGSAFERVTGKTINNAPMSVLSLKKPIAYARIPLATSPNIGVAVIEAHSTQERLE